VTSTAVPKQANLDELIKRLSEIRLALAHSENAFETRVDRIDPTYLKSVRNLAHYIALRHRDIRPLQEDLAQLGLSSLGRAEAHVMATLDAVLNGGPRTSRSHVATFASSLDFVEGNTVLREHTETLLGPSRGNRAVRIMVTLFAGKIPEHQ
jgi:pyruvate kinase